MSTRKRPLAPGADYCTSPITSIVRPTVNESSDEEGHGVVVGESGLRRPDTERNHFLLSPRDNSGVIHKRDSNNNGGREGSNASCDHMLFRRPQHLLTSQPGWLHAEVRGVRAHMVLVWLRVEPGGKKGPGNRNPPILTSCFCWKADLSARLAHQHRAHCSSGS